MHLHFIVGQRWGWQGEGCLYLLFLKKTVFLCEFFLLQITLPNSLFPRSFHALTSCHPSHSSNVPSESYHSISSRSPVGKPYLILFTTLTKWIITSLLFISLIIMETPWEPQPWLSSISICSLSLIQCLGSGWYIIIIMRTFHELLRQLTLKQTNAFCYETCTSKLSPGIQFSGWCLFSLEYGIWGFKQQACDGSHYLHSSFLYRNACLALKRFLWYPLKYSIALLTF